MRYIKALKDTVATKENGVNLFKVNANWQCPVEGKVFSRGDKWLVPLAYEAGTWLFCQSDVDFFYDQLIGLDQAQAIYGRMPTLNQLNDLNNCLQKFAINTPNRKRHFLSQTAHESGGLSWFKELASGWGYENRSDLGNTQPGDGPRFKGAGVIQLTGRSNYQMFADYLNDPQVMSGCDYVAKVYPFTSAGFWWMNNGMNSLCDRNATVEEVTRKVNGGYNGLADRKAYYRKACRVIF